MPEGELTSFTYDARGNRRTQSNGRGALARTAMFNYDAFNRVTSVFERGALDSSYVFYDPRLGNVSSTRSSLGIMGYVDRDAIGRDSVTRSPLDAAQQHMTRSRRRYDIMDRDPSRHEWSARCIGQASVSGVYDEGQRDSLIVSKKYDAEGNLLSVTRRVNPNPNGLSDLTTTWSYDAAHRKRREIAPDQQRDTTIYGDGVERDAHRGSPRLRRDDDVRRAQSAQDAHAGPTSVTAILGTTTPGGMETFEYDALGNVREAANAYAIVDREYNIGGTIRREVQRIATENGQFGLHDYELLYSYDLENRRLTLRQPWQAMIHMIGDGNPGPLNVPVQPVRRSGADLDERPQSV